MRIFSLTLLLFTLQTYTVVAQQFTRNDIQNAAEFIVQLQLPTGAMKTAVNASYYHDNGVAIYEIVPYFAHIGCLGLLYSDHPQKCAIVKKWLTWYSNHLQPNGQIFNYYSSADGSIETDCFKPDRCRHIDAEDSHVALFWILAEKYYSISKDKFFLKDIKNKLEAGATYLSTTLWTANNLTLNLHPPNDTAVEFTMDNSEVYKGFVALSNIEKVVYGRPGKAALYATKAVLLQKAIRSKLYNSNSGLYKQRLGVDVIQKNWYSPDGIVAAVWPELFGVDVPNSQRGKIQRQVMNKNFIGDSSWTSPAFPGNVDSFSWASIGYLHSKAGDTARGYAQAFYLKDKIKPGCDSTICIIQDAGWFIMNMSTKLPAQTTCQ